MSGFCSKVLLISSFLIASLFAEAQEKEDVLYLSNGSVLRGALVPSPDSSSLAIQILGGSIFVVNKEEINRITQEEALEHDFLVGAATPKEPKERGFELSVFTSRFLRETEDEFSTSVIRNSSFGFAAGHRFSRRLLAQLAFSADHIDNLFFAPLYLHLSSDILKKQHTPFVHLDLGHNANFITNSDVRQGGAMWVLGTGYKYLAKSNVAVQLGFSLRFQRATNTRDAWDPETGRISSYEEIRDYYSYLLSLRISI